MALSEVTTQRNGATATSGSSITATWPATPANGDLMVVAISGNAAVAPQTPPSGWTLVGPDASSADGTIWIYHRLAGASEPSTHTWTWTSGQPTRIALRGSQYTGWVGTPAVDKHNGTTGGSATAGPGAHGTLAAADEVVLVCYNQRGRNQGGVWSNLNNSQVSTGESRAASGTTMAYLLMARRVVSATTDTTYTATCTQDVDGLTNWQAAVVTFKDNPPAITGTGAIAAPAAQLAATGTHTIPPVTGTGAIEAPAVELAATGVQTFDPAHFPTEPDFRVYIDFDGDGAFDPGDEVTADLHSSSGVEWERGRSADFGTDAIGAATIILKNVGATLSTPGIYSPEINPNLIPGRAVLVKSTYVGVERPHFFGFIQRVSPDAQAFTVTITLYDPLKRMAETDIVVPANALVQRTARDMRIAVLEDFERGTRNLIDNPELATDLAGWDITSYSAGGPTLTRITTDAPPTAGSTCGEYVAMQANNRILIPVRLAPIYFVQTIYRVAIYLRTNAGTAQWKPGLGLGFAQFVERTVLVTESWQRFTLTFTVATTTKATATEPLMAVLTALGAGTVRVGGVSVTRGQALYPYEAEGSGRWPSWCGNGSFDASALGGWFDAFANLVANPSFETDTAGWSGAADAFHAAADGGGAITRVTTGTHRFGSAHLEFATSGPNAGVHYVLPGTFKAGLTYRFRLPARVIAGGASEARLGVGSQGTPADFAESSNTSVTAGAGWSELAVTWIPAADRTDAHLYMTNQAGTAITYSIDGASGFRRDQAASVDPLYSDTGPGGGIGSFVTTRAIGDVARYGSHSQEITTPATIGAGRVYDFGHLGGLFVAGRPYTVIVSVQPSSSMPYRVGLGANALDGTWDEDFVDGTAPADEWTDVEIPWTPSADRSSTPASAGTANLNACLFVMQTDATARTILIDGVRVIPEATMDEVEMGHWVLPAESDVYLPTAQLATNALAALGVLNGLTLSRHFIRPTLTAPFYQYVVTSRDDVAAKVVAESFAGNFAGFTEADVDRDAIVNVLPVSYAGGITYYGDADSVRAYGPQPENDIGNSAYFPDSTIGDVIGPALIARYKDPRGRPVWERTAKSAAERISQMERELDDLIAVSLPRLGLVAKGYLIVKSKTKVNRSGMVWQTTWTLEEQAAYPTADPGVPSGSFGPAFSDAFDIT